MSNSDRFLKAFNAVDKILKKQIDERPGKGSSTTTGFAARVRLAEDKGIISRHTSGDLLELAELRNAIVHDTTDLAIAEPHADTVSLIEGILSRLERPVLVKDRGNIVSIFDLSSPIADVLKYMADNKFSQVVVMKDYHIRVITTESIALWLANRVTEEIVELSEPLQNVLKYEMKGAFKCIPRHMPIELARQNFEDAVGTGGVRLYCLVVTQNGKDTDRAERIITPWDLM